MEKLLASEVIYIEPGKPLPIRIDIEADRATPVIASMLAKILQDAGAKVVSSDVRVFPTNKTFNLDGLVVHIGKLVWVTTEETERWGEKIFEEKSAT